MEFKLIGPLHDVELSFFVLLRQFSFTWKLFYTTTLLTDGLRGRNYDFVLLRWRCGFSPRTFFYILREPWTNVVGVLLLHIVLVGNEITGWIVNILALRLVYHVVLLRNLMRNPGQHIALIEWRLKVVGGVGVLLLQKRIVEVAHLRLHLR